MIHIDSFYCDVNSVDQPYISHYVLYLYTTYPSVIHRTSYMSTVFTLVPSPNVNLPNGTMTWPWTATGGHHPHGLEVKGRRSAGQGHGSCFHTTYGARTRRGEGAADSIGQYMNNIFSIEQLQSELSRTMLSSHCATTEEGLCRHYV